MVQSKGLASSRPLKSGTDELVEHVINGIREKKGHDIVLIDLRSIRSSLADLFVVCHGDSDVHVKAIAQSVADEVEKHTGESPVYKEGFSNAEWILLDYIHVVVHVFRKEQREYYGIEEFWADAETQRIDDNIN